MNLSSIVFAGVAALAIQGIAWSQPAPAGDPIAIMGCLIRADEGGFLVVELGRSIPRDGAVGTSGRASTVLYWVDDDAMELFDHVGHRVEMTGRVVGDVDQNAVNVTPREPWTEIAFRSGSKTVRARLPRAAQPADEAPADPSVRKFQRETMRLAGLSCRP